MAVACAVVLAVGFRALVCADAETPPPPGIGLSLLSAALVHEPQHGPCVSCSASQNLTTNLECTEPLESLYVLQQSAPAVALSASVVKEHIWQVIVGLEGLSWGCVHEAGEGWQRHMACQFLKL